MDAVIRTIAKAVTDTGAGRIYWLPYGGRFFLKWSEMR